MNIDRTLRHLASTVPLLQAEIAMRKEAKARCWQKADKSKPDGEQFFKAFCHHKRRLQKVRKELKTTNELICFLKKQRKTPKKVEC